MKVLENGVSEGKKKKKDMVILQRLPNQEEFPFEEKEKEEEWEKNSTNEDLG